MPELRTVIAVPMRGFSQWGGGIDFIRQLIEGLTHDRNAEVIVLIPRPTRARRLREFAGAAKRSLQDLGRGKFKWHQSTPFTPEQIQHSIQDFVPRISVRFHVDTPAGLNAALRACRADVAVPCMEPLGTDAPVPWVGYIFDFQHRHLKQFFKDSEIQARDAAFAGMLEAAKVVICNSETVREEAHRFYPGLTPHIVSLPYAPVPREEWWDLEPGPVIAKFGLPARYFMVCNQFWIHKDHMTAIRAFARFRELSGDTDAVLVCTGSLHDFRAPQHGEAVLGLIRELGLEGHVHLLGHIAKSEQIALLNGAIALLQPTLFEGGRGGGAVYDAVSIGTPAIVSDIPVNREITDGSVRFFRSQDPESMAALMVDQARQGFTRQDRGELVAARERRLAALSDSLYHSIRLARACLETNDT